jgi:hypothetical protein
MTSEAYREYDKSWSLGMGRRGCPYLDALNGRDVDCRGEADAKVDAETVFARQKLIRVRGGIINLGTS